MGDLTYALTAPLTRLLSDPSLSVGAAPEPEVAQTLFDHATKTYAGSNEPGVKLTCGLVFHATTQGEVRQISFWKTAADVATSRTVALYPAAGGAAVATGVSSGEPVGVAQWVTVSLDSPYTVEALDNYVAAVFYPEGAYPALAEELISAVSRGDLTAESRSVAPGGQCRYAYGATIAYPNQNSAGTGFGVDVGFFPDAFPTSQDTGPSGTLTPMTGGVNLWSGGSTVLEDVDLTGFVVIQAENCIVRNCRITNNDGGATAVIRVDTGSSTGVGLLIENCIIDGAGITVNGIAAEGTFRNNTIVGCDNGINVYGPSTIKGNYILCETSASPEPHFDGIEINGGSDIVIMHNTVGVNQSQTSAVMMNNFFAGLSDIDVIDNYLFGGGYTLYCDNGHSAEPVDAASIRVFYNKMGTGLFGYFALYTSGVTPVGNVDATTGEPVS